MLGLLNIYIFKYAMTANFQFFACVRGEKSQKKEDSGLKIIDREGLEASVVITHAVIVWIK